MTNKIDFSQKKLSQAVLINKDFSGALLTETDLSKGNFSGTNFSGSDFSNAVLSEAILTKANLSNAKLAKVTAYNTDFTAASLNSCQIIESNLTRNHFLKSNLNSAQITESDLIGCIFTESFLTDAMFVKNRFNLTDFKESFLIRTNFSKSTFTKVNLIQVHAEESDFSECILKEVVVRYGFLMFGILTQTQLQQSDFNFCDLSSVKANCLVADQTNFSHTRWTKTTCTQGKFTKVVAIEFEAPSSDFSETQFLNCDFSRANFTFAKLQDAKFYGSNFSYVDFSGADLTNADFSNCCLFEAIFDKAILDGTKLDQAFFTLQKSPDLIVKVLPEVKAEVKTQEPESIPESNQITLELTSNQEPETLTVEAENSFENFQVVPQVVSPLGPLGPLGPVELSGFADISQLGKLSLEPFASGTSQPNSANPKDNPRLKPLTQSEEIERLTFQDAIKYIEDADSTPFPLVTPSSDFQDSQFSLETQVEHRFKEITAIPVAKEPATDPDTIALSVIHYQPDNISLEIKPIIDPEQVAQQILSNIFQENRDLIILGLQKGSFSPEIRSKIAAGKKSFNEKIPSEAQKDWFKTVLEQQLVLIKESMVD